MSGIIESSRPPYGVPWWQCGTQPYSSVDQATQPAASVPASSAFAVEMRHGPCISLSGLASSVGLNQSLTANWLNASKSGVTRA
ncbi:MAG: hypothetical protein MUE75_01730 [Algoriphagus sp.]|nr:hypothetical protein [Algoriphagus sp.]